MIEGLLQPTHLIIILVIVLIVFGAGKLSDVGGALGKSVKEFKESTQDLKCGPSTEPIQSASTNSSIPQAPVQQQQAAQAPRITAPRADDL
jgi:sec-independent protein translocase protein TatA